MRMEGYTGRDFQLDFLGKKVDWREIFSQKKTDIKKYMPFNKAIEFIEKNYPVERAILPETKVGRDLYNLTAENLGLDPENIEKLVKRLRFYNTLETPLDTYHGVDAFFVYEDESGKKHFCTIDLSLNPKKEEGYKANLIINEFPDYKLAKPAYLKWLEMEGKEIADVLKRPYH